jgi:hypothetical protein
MFVVQFPYALGMFIVESNSIGTKFPPPRAPENVERALDAQHCQVKDAVTVEIARDRGQRDKRHHQRTIPKRVRNRPGRTAVFGDRAIHAKRTVTIAKVNQCCSAAGDRKVRLPVAIEIGNRVLQRSIQRGRGYER